MKTYTFKLSKNNKTADIYKESLMKRVVNAYPWLTVESNYDYPKCTYGIEYAGAGDYITLGLSKTHNIGWLPKECAECPFKCFADGSINFDLEKNSLTHCLHLIFMLRRIILLRRITTLKTNSVHRLRFLITSYRLVTISSRLQLVH